VNAVRGFLSIVLLASLLPLSSFAAPQGQRQTSDVEAERLRIQAEEKARQEIEQRDWETRIFPVKYVDLIQLNTALSMFRAKTMASPDLRVISVRAPKEIMPAIEDAIKRLDVPQPRSEAELTIYVVVGSDQPELPSAIPSNLNAVVNQLRGVLAYKGYRLLDTLITRGTGYPWGAFSGGETTLSGALVISETVKPSYNFSTRFQIENDGKSPLLRLNNMRFQLQGSGLSAGVSGTVDIPRGQQVVVGKATLGEKALILVMSAKFD
jgi:hypothetical protein